MITLILLAIIAFETYWLWKVGAFHGVLAWATGAVAAVAAFWEQIVGLF